MPPGSHEATISGVIWASNGRFTRDQVGSQRTLSDNKKTLQPSGLVKSLGARDENRVADGVADGSAVLPQRGATGRDSGHGKIVL
jgi:hypothetical protein